MFKGFRGKRDRTSRLAKVRRQMQRKPSALVAQAKVADVKREDSIKGKKMPPSDPPQLARPVAKPRRTWNQCPMVPTATVDRREVPKPARMPKTSMK